MERLKWHLITMSYESMLLGKSSSGVTTEPADPQCGGPSARGGPCTQPSEFFLLTSNAYSFPLLSFSQSILDICCYLLKQSIKRHMTLTRAGFTCQLCHGMGTPDYGSSWAARFFIFKMLRALHYIIPGKLMPPIRMYKSVMVWNCPGERSLSKMALINKYFSYGRETAQKLIRFQLTSSIIRKITKLHFWATL